MAKITVMRSSFGDILKVLRRPIERDRKWGEIGIMGSWKKKMGWVGVWLGGV